MAWPSPLRQMWSSTPNQSAVEPDLLFIMNNRGHIVHEEAVFGSPHLVIEVLSEGTRRRELGVKLRLDAHPGVRFYWVADPVEQVIRVYTRQDGGHPDPTFLLAEDILAWPLFTGGTTPADAVFAG